MTAPETSSTPPRAADPTAERKAGNTCLALGVSVGALGAAGAALSGAVCPLCVVAAPGLIGLGMFKRWRGRTSLQVPPLKPE